jgi:hypothetical protein
MGALPSKMMLGDWIAPEGRDDRNEAEASSADEPELDCVIEEK